MLILQSETIMDPDERTMLQKHSKDNTPLECGKLTIDRLVGLLDNANRALFSNKYHKMLFAREKLQMDLMNLSEAIPNEGEIFMKIHVFLWAALSELAIVDLRHNRNENEKKILAKAFNKVISSLSQALIRLGGVFEHEFYH